MTLMAEAQRLGNADIWRYHVLPFLGCGPASITALRCTCRFLSSVVGAYVQFGSCTDFRCVFHNKELSIFLQRAADSGVVRPHCGRYCIVVQGRWPDNVASAGIGIICKMINNADKDYLCNIRRRWDSRTDSLALYVQKTKRICIYDPGADTLILGPELRGR